MLGVAVGGREDDYSASGVDFHTRGRRFDAMLEEWQRIWAGECFGTAGAIGPRAGRRAPDADRRRPRGRRRSSARRAYGDGWVDGRRHARPVHQGAAQLRAAWQAAGRDGEPRTLALAYFALGDDAEAAADGYLRDYYGFLGDVAGDGRRAARPPTPPP